MEACSEQMHAAAIEGQKIARKYFVVELDFSPGSLKDLDGIWGDVEYALPGGRSEVNGELLERTWGAYLGEVLRRHVGGDWVWDEQQGTPRPSLQRDSQQAFPIEFTRRRYDGEARQSFEDYFAEMQAKLQG